MGPHHSLQVFLETCINFSTSDCLAPAPFPSPSDSDPCIPLEPPPPNHSTKSNLSIHIIIIISVAVTIFLLLSYYGIIVKLWVSRRRRRPPPTAQSDTTQPDDFDDETQDPIHHIWYVRTVGLEQAVINSISVCKYKRGDGLVESTECSVCLTEFKDDENLRLLPKCSHAFHVDCIDTWLNSHTNCPLCRAGIVSSSPSSSSVDPALGSLDQTDETQMGNLVVDIEIGSDGTDQSSVSNDEGELPGDDGRGVIANGNGMSSSALDCGFRVFSDLGDNHQTGERSIDGIQPVRRSVSMDFSSASVMYSLPIGSDDNKSNLGEFLGKKGMIPKHHSRSQRICKVIGSGSKGPVAMKRSFSSGRKLFLSRYGRGQNSILPL
eukprot:TRINITY_DN26133_c0_g1_i1.p1 TRINITY_DN26133_c0_g1~~TRINITY_DN26133_c0_g1_i1.p1  ORF type:complete len:378 (+),score=40.96 TRINITY_DN26133_c0_g1_i1:143-1276(+)